MKRKAGELNKLTTENRRILILIGVLFGVEQIGIVSEYMLTSFANYGRYLQMFFMVLAAATSYGTILRRRLLKFVLLEVVLLLVVLLSSLSEYVREAILWSKYVNIALIYLPLLLCTECLEVNDSVIKVLTKFSYYLLVAPTTTLIFKFVVNNDINGRMSASYSLLVPLLFVIRDSLETNRISKRIISTICFMTLVLFGSRGATICAIAFLVIVLFINRDISKALLTSVATVLAFLFSRNLLGVLLDLRISSRTLQIYLSGGLSSLLFSKERAQIQSWFVEILRRNPILGVGMTGGWLSPGEHPHNILLEVAVSFGLIIGCVISLLWIIELIKSLGETNTSYGVMRLIFAVASLSLLVSGTFLTSKSWYILWGLIINERKNVRAPAIK